VRGGGGGGGAGTPARAEYLYRRPSDGAPASSVHVLFPDGRLFHALDLATGDSGPLEHACAPDSYTGRVCATGAHALRIEWSARGPAKDYTAVTELERLHEGTGAVADDR